MLPWAGLRAVFWPGCVGLASRYGFAGAVKPGNVNVIVAIKRGNHAAHP